MSLNSQTEWKCRGKPGHRHPLVRNTDERCTYCQCSFDEVERIEELQVPHSKRGKLFFAVIVGAIAIAGVSFSGFVSRDRASQTATLINSSPKPDVRISPTNVAVFSRLGDVKVQRISKQAAAFDQASLPIDAYVNLYRLDVMEAASLKVEMPQVSAPVQVEVVRRDWQNDWKLIQAGQFLPARAKTMTLSLPVGSYLLRITRVEDVQDGSANPDAKVTYQIRVVSRA